MSEAAAREARGQKCQESAREARFAATGEPSEAPGPDDVKAERAVTASKGSKSSKLEAADRAAAFFF